MSDHSPRYHTLLNFSGIILGKNALGILAVIIKSCFYAQILNDSPILNHKRLFQTADNMPVSIQNSTKIIYRKIYFSINLNIFCKTIMCTCMVWNHIQIFQGIYLIWILRCSISSCRGNSSVPGSDHTINNIGITVRRNCKFSILQLYNNSCSRFQGIFCATISCKNRISRCFLRCHSVSVKTVSARCFTSSYCCIKICKKCFKGHSCNLFQIFLTV